MAHFTAPLYLDDNYDISDVITHLDKMLTTKMDFGHHVQELLETCNSAEERYKLCIRAIQPFGEFISWSYRPVSGVITITYDLYDLNTYIEGLEKYLCPRIGLRSMVRIHNGKSSIEQICGLTLNNTNPAKTVLPYVFTLPFVSTYNTKPVGRIVKGHSSVGFNNTVGRMGDVKEGFVELAVNDPHTLRALNMHYAKAYIEYDSKRDSLTLKYKD